MDFLINSTLVTTRNRTLLKGKKLPILAYTLIITILCQNSAFGVETTTRRAKPAPYDSVFPSTEYLGPTIGVPNLDPIYPLNQGIWDKLPQLKDDQIRIYGWINPSVNASSSKHSNVPLSYTIVPNNIELDQAVLRIERVPDTVQTHSIDWGFRLSNIYGMDYRYTTSQGYFSGQLLEHNELYGYDPVVNRGIKARIDGAALCSSYRHN